MNFYLKHKEEGLTVGLKSELGDVPFYWEFRCTPVSVAVVRLAKVTDYKFEHITQTLITKEYNVCL